MRSGPKPRPRWKVCSPNVLATKLGAGDVSPCRTNRVGGDEGIAPVAGMAKENREEFGAALAGRDALERLLRDVATALRERTGESLADALGGLVTPVDRAALNGPFADWVARSMRTALASDIWGWLDDDLAFVRDWGFSLDAIRVPISVWQGRHDAMVPFGHGEWLAGNVPGARARLLDDEGHLSLPLRFAEIVDDLLTAA